MNALTYAAMTAEVDSYLSDKGRQQPYFLSLDDNGEYTRFLSSYGSRVHARRLAMSGFCNGPDVFPDVDAMLQALRTPAETVGTYTLLVGIGDCIRLQGAPELIGRLRDAQTGRKVVVVCHGCRGELQKAAETNPRFGERQVAFGASGLAVPVEVYPPDFQIDALRGIKELLRALEDGGAEPIRVKSDRDVVGALYIRSAYDAYRRQNPASRLQEVWLSQEQWREMVADPSLGEHPVDHWRTFLRYKAEGVPEGKNYLASVLAATDHAADWRRNLIRHLTSIPRQSADFDVFYRERRELLRNLDAPYGETDGSDYAAQVRACSEGDRYAYMTDLAKSERRALLGFLGAQEDVPKDLDGIDARLADYLHDFVFAGPDGDLYTRYFSRYKRQKVLNRIEAGFLADVETLATTRPYNALPTRGAVVDTLRDADTGLCWVDALGCEYLGYIQKAAARFGLSMTVRPTRVNLPSLTAYNREFFDSWTVNNVRWSTPRLDDIKHSGTRDYDYQANKTPAYLVDELEVLDEAMAWIADRLTGRIVRRVVLASDHGASRLAVIRESENKWEMAPRGEHSGRCCPKTEIGERPDCATEETAPDGHSFWVLANYDRFKGGRKAQVEVHGGASLEEVVVPVVEFTLRGPAIEIRNLTPEVTARASQPATLKLFSATALHNVSVEIDGTRYPAASEDGRNLAAILTGFRRAGRHTATVYENDDDIGTVDFTLKSGLGRIDNGGFGF